jgi:hypothetical protein
LLKIFALLGFHVNVSTMRALLSKHKRWRKMDVILRASARFRGNQFCAVRLAVAGGQMLQLRSS